MSKPKVVVGSESVAMKTRKLAQFIRESGLIAGRSNGVPWRDDGMGNELDAVSIGLYLPTQRSHRKVFGFTICREWGYVGKIDTKDWMLVVYGRENVDRLKDLAEKMAQKFGADVHVCLEREETRWECLSCSNW